MQTTRPRAASWPLGGIAPKATLSPAWKIWPQNMREKKRAFRFPLSPIVEAWQRIDPVAEPDKHSNAIAPNILRGGYLQTSVKPSAEASRLPDLGEVAAQGPTAELPSLETPKSGQLVPVLPLVLYDHKGQLHNHNTRGPASISIRLLFEALLGVDYDLRQPNRVIPVEATLGEVKDWLWPTGWRRRDNLSQLQAALHELNDLLVELEVDGDVGLHNLVMAHTRPDLKSSLDFPIRFQVFQLPGGGHGPLIARQELRRWGATSAPAYRAYLRLAYLWDDVKARRRGRRVLATRPKVLRDAQGFLVDAQGRRITDRQGQPTKNWSNPQAVKTGELERNPDADLVPQLGPEDLTELCYWADPKFTSQDIADRARKSAEDSSQDGSGGCGGAGKGRLRRVADSCNLAKKGYTDKAIWVRG